MIEKDAALPSGFQIVKLNPKLCCRDDEIGFSARQAPGGGGSELF